MYEFNKARRCFQGSSKNYARGIGMMKIIFLDPGFGEQGFNTFGNSHWSSVIHHGLCSISAHAKSKGYSDIELVDLRKLKGRDHF